MQRLADLIGEVVALETRRHRIPPDLTGDEDDPSRRADGVREAARPGPARRLVKRQTALRRIRLSAGGLIRLGCAEPEPLNLARQRPRQLRDELDGARILVRRELRLDEVLQLLRERVRRRDAGARTTNAFTS